MGNREPRLRGRRPVTSAWLSTLPSTRRGFATTWLTLIALLCSPISGCGESTPPADDAFRVGLLTPGSIRDAGWNQGAYEGLEGIAKELGAEIGHQETRTPQEFEAGFRDFAQRGFDLVFGHGFEFQDAAAAVAADYPDTVFITTSGSTIRPNVSPIVFELEQATYVLGYVGRKLSKQGRLGAIGGMEIPSVASTFTAFEAGARAASESESGSESEEAEPVGSAPISVARSYIGGWEDVSAAKEATLAQIAQGADVLIHNADAAAQGFFQALRETPGAIGFGTNRNQNDLAPESVLASATLDIPKALLLVAREVQQDRFEPRLIRYGLRDGVVGIVWNEPLLAKRAPELRGEIDALVARIEAGEVEVPRGF